MHTRTTNRELWYAVIAILCISAAYLFVVLWYEGIPRARGLFGHSIGILGFLLMLMTETLYSLRKRSRRARWGRMSGWLDFHIFTGLVGPYMVLLHTSWKFNGLAGVVMLLTVVIVVSGFIGRYIYTALPRTADGAEIEASVLETQINSTNTELNAWLLNSSEESVRSLARQLSFQSPQSQSPLRLLFGRTFDDWRYRLFWRRELKKLGLQIGTQIEQLNKLLQRQRALQRQMASLAMARRMLALWHAVHIPIGMALFAAAFVHIIAAIYYATLLR
ncbi:MAG: hypothetical protein JSV61_12030 [Anaerolineales bacterium]|nr:MAG: hypothetical protein JSV61_12030 [Anaerolineales bacterium]